MTQPFAQNLITTFTRLYRYAHLASMVGWDQSAMMPPKGNEARAAALAELQVLMHQTLTSESLEGLFKGAAAENLTEDERASVREMRRHWEEARRLPERLVEAQSLAQSRCEHAWRTQRKHNDWQGFLGNFREVVALARQEARLLADAKGSTCYDALMDKYEPGMRSVDIDRIFGDVKSWLPELIRKTVAKQSLETVIQPQGPFPISQQRSLGLEIMKVLQFDFDAGRLDVSTHPFCGGVAEDVRITTRYSEDDFMRSLMGIVHETGHARYEQGLPRELVHLPVGQARSMGIHESQSLFFEMQLGRSPQFLALIAPLINEHLGQQAAFDTTNLATLFSRVKPGLIRVDADELTYPAHIILRFEIERALIEGEIEAEDIPAMWDEKMMSYLGQDTRGNFQDGCLQDVHWPGGSFGYFPSYTLGSMYGAQFSASMRGSQPDLDAQVLAGNLSFIFSWLEKHIWCEGSRWSTDELVKRATGEALNPAHFRQHLERRYLGL
ncbi:MAG: carboxypeptidase M32 [Gammaproteobacteria bacterium]|uniref:carboxypeptidase M32 n=1 Tax=Rhodoferax sp. TaxID=50421 RepID=UPI0017C94846|nr:carboxypeptidase M32 [Rhodoferax sp.]MBU3898654.1 carboxypeptidase M32 [Gammaproteobacteria bacterium]MBA3057029.1 carboxypeptidase M32 [Rhodoferax sp.]MBU3997757.1 carboxypeptidase M32 [Gammaproteobacteria bacterium]MBU4019563.1 carboxypeptidase M32 [Gammaproteobacteria bacterium]MBU4079077.1 carboxypeptidase M32 [Gammaproteobacteria bacterium]